MRTFKSAQKSALTNKSSQKSTLKSTFGSSAPIWQNEKKEEEKEEEEEEEDGEGDNDLAAAGCAGIEAPDKTEGGALMERGGGARTGDNPVKTLISNGFYLNLIFFILMKTRRTARSKL